VTWFHGIVLGAAGLAAMRAAIERGDLDEAAHQGALAGPVVIEAALAAPDRPARLAAIVAAPRANGRAELLDALAVAAGGPDRRVAIPAAYAARTIARELAQRDPTNTELPDDLAAEDVTPWRQAWAELAGRADRWIELRVVALDTAAALDVAARGPTGTGVELANALRDPDPAYRRAAVAVVPMPVPATLRSVLAGAVATDTDDAVALDAARVLCADLTVDPPRPVLDALGPAGLARIRSLVTGSGPASAIRDASRCLAADKRR
jgi:hypothetical protein